MIRRLAFILLMYYWMGAGLHSVADHTPGRRICGKEISEVRYDFIPRQHSPYNRVYIFPMHKGSHLWMMANFTPELVDYHPDAIDGFYASQDGGKTWRLLEPHAQPSDLSAQMRRLISTYESKVPSGNRHQYKFEVRKVETSGEPSPVASIMLSRNGGVDWQTMPTLADGLPVPPIMSIVPHPTEPLTIYFITYNRGATAGNSKYALYISKDGGVTLEMLHTEITSRPVLTISPSSPNIMYAVNTTQKVVKSRDGGRTWRPVGQSDEQRKHYLLASDLAKGTDISNLGPTFYQEIIMDPTFPEIVYVVSSRGIFKTIDGGEHWRILDLGIEHANAYSSMVLDPGNRNVVYVGTIYGLFKSTDQGCTWEKIEIHKRLIK